MPLNRINHCIRRLPAGRSATALACGVADWRSLAWTVPMWEIRHA